MATGKIINTDRDKCVWLPDVRAALADSAEAVPVIFSLTLCTGERIDRVHPVPKWQTEAEREFAREYLNACVFNTMALYSGRELRFFPYEREESVMQLLEALPGEFSSGGLSKCIKVANRVSRGFGGGEFRFVIDEIENYRPLPQTSPEERQSLAKHLRAAEVLERSANCCGVDIGGTDIKLCAAKGERLICVKEFDWNPAESDCAEGIIAPILILVRLMRACLMAEGKPIYNVLIPALEKTADIDTIYRAVEAVENTLGSESLLFDAVGISFPDVAICDRIIGGETPKTRGMRNNPEIDYETEFARITKLNERIAPFCRRDAKIRIINDGSMAAFTAAMELAHSPDAGLIEDGVIAHSLGTDLGTGWMNSRGEIPPIALEMYDALLDLGSLGEREYDTRDVRCVCNENSGLPGVRRYMGQAAAFRYAYANCPEMVEKFIVREGSTVLVREKDPDMRKPCLEHLMQLAEQGNAAAEDIFITIGKNLGKVCREMEYHLQTGLDTRFLFGRFVKRLRCFELICQGCAETAPEIKLIAADSDMACTPLMQALNARADATVAQFGQAVGSLYFAFM